MNREPKPAGAENGNVFVAQVLKDVADQLDAEVNEQAAHPPHITDTKEHLARTALRAANLAGQREMLDRIYEQLGLTREQ